MRAPTEILGIRYFLLGVIFTRTDTRVESSQQGNLRNKNKSFSFHFQTARAFGPGLLILLEGLPAPLGRTTTYYHILLRGFRLLVPSRPGLISYRIRVQYPLYPIYNVILLTPEWEERICAMSTPSQRLAEEAQAQRVHLPKSTIPKHYEDFADVFSEEAFAHLPPHKAWDHAIELNPDAKLPRGRTFPLSPAEQKELDAFLRENLANG